MALDLKRIPQASSFRVFMGYGTLVGSFPDEAEALQRAIQIKQQYPTEYVWTQVTENRQIQVLSV